MLRMLQAATAVLCLSGCVDYSSRSRMIVNDSYDDTQVSFSSPSERQGDPRASESDYIYLVKDCLGVKVSGPGFSAGDDADQLFALENESISRGVNLNNLTYAVSVNPRLSYEIYIDDFDEELVLSRVILMESDGRIDSTFYFAAVGDGVAHDLVITASVDGETENATSPLSIESRAGPCQGVHGSKVYLGVFASPEIEDGILRLSVSEDSSASLEMAFSELPPVTLSGTLDKNGVLDIDDGGYRLEGQMLTDVLLTGTYTGPNTVIRPGYPPENPGGFALFDATDTEVGIYCGIYEGSRTGELHIMQWGNKKISGIVAQENSEFAAVLAQNIFDGTNFEFYVAGTSDDWVFNGNLDRQDASGTWSCGPAVVGSGEFSASRDACPQF